MKARRSLPALLLVSCPVALAQSQAALDAVDARQMSIPAARTAFQKGGYPGSALTVRQTLAPGGNYTRQVVSYQSEGLRINALLTVPRGTPPKGGWPAIVFNHGYIPPAEYRTTERYVAYQDAFARAGFVTLKSDYRGHGSSEGQALGARDVARPDRRVEAIARVVRHADRDPPGHLPRVRAVVQLVPADGQEPLLNLLAGQGQHLGRLGRRKQFDLF